jgi:outer membrane protein OmpA-like peptidoglycan-associated protein
MRPRHSVIVAAAAVVWLGAAPALAEMPGSSAPPSEEEISRSLAPRVPEKTRGLPIMGRAPATANPAIGPANTPPVAAADAAHPSATFHTIQFEFGSARLTPDSIATLKNLGNALNHALRDQQHFAIEGHTDARGSAGYNETLSRERAQSVLDYLVNEMGVAADRLQAVGKGFSEPVPGSDPYAPVNRRVVIVNLAG